MQIRTMLPTAATGFASPAAPSAHVLPTFAEKAVIRFHVATLE